MKHVIPYKLMEDGRVIKSDVQCQQLDDLNEPLYQIYPALAKRKGVILNYVFIVYTIFIRTM